MQQEVKQQPPPALAVTVVQLDNTSLKWKILQRLSRFQVKFGSLSTAFGITNLILAFYLPCYWPIGTHKDRFCYFDWWAVFSTGLILGIWMLACGILNFNAAKTGSQLKMKIGLFLTIISVLISVGAVAIETIGAIQLGDLLNYYDWDPDTPWSGYTQANIMMCFHSLLAVYGLVNFIVGLGFSIKILCMPDVPANQIASSGAATLPGFNPNGGYSNPSYQPPYHHQQQQHIVYNHQQQYQQQYGFQGQNPPPYPHQPNPNLPPSYYQQFPPVAPQSTVPYPQQGAPLPQL